MSQLLLGFNQRGVEVLQDLEVESRQNGGGFSNKFENGQPRSNVSFYPEDLHVSQKSVQAETNEARPAVFLSFNQNKRGMFGKRENFGIEIPENSIGMSTVTSHGLDPMSVHSWSDAAHSEILSVSSRAIFNGNSSRNGSWTYGQLNTSSTALLQDHYITRGKLLVDSNSRSLPSSLAEGLAQNDFLGAFDCKKPRACKSLPWMMEAKSAIDLNAGTMAADGYEIEEISGSDFASVNGSIKQNSNGGLSWLRAPRPSYVKPNKDVEGSRVDDPKHRKNDTSYSSSSTKLLGFSVTENICQDLPSPNMPLKPSSHASAIDGVNSDMTRRPLLVADTSSDNPNANAGRIDLNLRVTGKGIEDIQSTSFSVRTNVRIAEIDLEMPVKTKMGTRDTLDYKSLENSLTRPSNLLHVEADQSPGLTSVSVAGS
ncbi:uncharacterized protein LOC120118608 [Hibiscus syriacus]|uniref:uncharacterized protein LOC120118608 n=1 Tax=Hibiscus syriacus TaxID=106335 RepID=UPI00192428B5|nr:uncharacterized protein LOC120118608 [Hibiscus syriacus]